MGPLTNAQRQKRFRERHKMMPIHPECWCHNCQHEKECKIKRSRIESIGRTGTIVELERSPTYWGKLYAIAVSDLKSWYKRNRDYKNRIEFERLKELFEEIEKI
jgi:hypothetical protein